MSDFVHLHLHSQYSVLDGAIKLHELVKRAKQLGQTAIAVTDHGTMHGAIEFYQAAVAEEIKPIIGCEVYITSGSRHEKVPTSQGGAQTYHLTLLAKDKLGYQNLCKLVTLGFTEGFYFRPRIDHEILKEFNQGLICLSGCLSSEFASPAKVGNEKAAEEIARKYQEIFGERYFLEVQPHAILEQRTVNAVARTVGDRLGIPLVATNDCHYLDANDHYAQEVLMCISTGKLITDEDRMRHDGARLHFKTADEMLSELPSFSDAIAHTRDIGKLCSVDFDFSTYHMPRFDPPKEVTLDDFFAKESAEGLKKRYQQCKDAGQEIPENLKAVYQARLEEEIDLIKQMGFGGYFLVVSDFIRYAKSNDIPVGPGRGSAAGSLIAWALEITEIDPIRYNLLFERFLNPERISLPDIDIDFCIYGREKVIDYVCNKYGRDKVAQIVTFGTLKAKAAIKDVGRALGMSYAETDRIAKLIPAPRQGFDYPIKEALQMEKRLREYAEGEGKKLIELAQKLEGLSRHTSTHAAGIVIADRPVVEFLPLMMDKEGQVVTQYSMGWVEKIGLVKFDFLGLKTLSVLHEAQKNIKADTGKDINLNALPLDDPKTYALISTGRTIGVFQLESSGITDMVTRMKPNCFEDLVAILALYRPGPLDAGMVDHYINRKHKREKVTYQHPLLERILKDTWGIILYQEQIMQIARDMAGYSLGEADMLRRAMGKKKPEEMAQQRAIFMKGATGRGVGERVASEVFDQMETFARYGFNRSHSVAYAMISFQTAYLKAHYPLHFMAALMTLEMGDTDKILKNLNECQLMKLEVLPPDVNTGNVGFGVVDRKIRFGLAAIKGVGEKAVEKIIETRNEAGKFKHLLDFAKRVDSAFVNRRSLEHFIKAGAFDWTKLPRAELFERVEEVLKLGNRHRDDAKSPQMGLFGAVAANDEQDLKPNRPLLPEWDSTVKLANEKEALGFYLTGHPLERFKSDLVRLGTIALSQLKQHQDGGTVTVAGVITFLKLKNTKKGDRYATFVLEDLSGTIEVIVWPDTYQKVQAALHSEDPVIVSAKLDISDERCLLIGNSIESAIHLRDKTAKEAVVVVSSKKCTPQQLEVLKNVFTEHKGACPVKLIIRNHAHSETVLALPPEYRVQPSEQLCTTLERLFGEPVLTFR